MDSQNNKYCHSSCSDDGICNNTTNSVDFGEELKDKMWTIKYSDEMNNLNVDEFTYVKKVIFSEGITSIKTQRFAGNKSIESILLPSTLLIIEDYAFYGVNIERIVIPKGVTTIENNAFDSCQKLSEVVLPSTLIAIGRGAFKNTGIEHIELPENITLIDDSCFSDCLSLHTVSLPIQLRRIGENAFYNTHISDIVVPEGCNSIGREAFRQCIFLLSITLPTTLREIGFDAFYNTIIEKVSFSEKIEQFDCKIPFFLKCLVQKDNIKCPNCFLDNSDSKSHKFVIDNECIIPEGVSHINEDCFYYCGIFSRIIIPSSLKFIHQEVFESNNIRSISFSEGVTSVQDNCFFNYSYINEITLPSTLRIIGNSSFSKTNIEEIEIPEGVTSIGNNCFSECRSLTNMHLPSSLLSIGFNAFYKTHIMTVILPEGVTQFDCKVSLLIMNLLKNNGVLCSHYFEDDEDKRIEEINAFKKTKCKWELNTDVMLTIGRYFHSSRDFIELMKVSKKFKKMVKKYEYNPISDTRLFRNIDIQHFYSPEEVKFKLRTVTQYIHWYEVKPEQTKYSRRNDVFKRINYEE